MVKISSSSAGMQVGSLIGELGLHVPPGPKHQSVKQKQNCNKFNKDFKNGPPQKRKKKVTGQQRQPKVEVPGGSPSSNLLMDGGRSVLRC